jgi:acetate---CoA ligase (ADP-forming)
VPDRSDFQRAALAETGRALFHPRSVAVLGASLVPEKPGARLIRALVAHGPGAEHVYAINPRKGDFGSVRSYAAIGDVDAPVDLAVIALPAEGVNDAVRECQRAGVGTAIVITAGFAEEGPEGAERQLELARIARDEGIRVLGPNCVGVVNFNDDVAPFFGSVLTGWNGRLSRGSVALVSQSGALASLLIERAFEQGLGLSHVATTGNEADLQWCDLVEYLSGLDEVSAIVGYLETVRDGPAFERALSLARERGKRVVVLRAGRTQVGRRSAAAHTAGVTTDAGALTAVLEKYGVIEVRSTDELLALAALLSHRQSVGRRVAIVAASGGLGAVLADRATEFGLQIPALSSVTQARLADVLPSHSSAANPVDGTGPLGRLPDVLSAACRVIDDSGEVDVIACFMGAGHAAARPAIADALVETSRGLRVPLLCGWLASSPEYVRTLNLGGVPTCSSPLDLLTAVSRLAAVVPGDDTAQAVEAADGGLVPPACSPVLVPASSVLDQIESAGVRVTRRVHVAAGPNALREVTAAAARLGSAFMLKAHRAGTGHKSEYGGVEGPLRPGDEDALRRFVSAQRDAASFEIQAFVRADWELYVSIRQDDTFGYTCVLGIGGILVDLVQSAVSLALPASADDITRVTLSSPLRGVLAGARGRTSVRPAELALLIKRLAAIADHGSYSVLELNPVMCEQGTGQLIAVDGHAELCGATAGKS